MATSWNARIKSNLKPLPNPNWKRPAVHKGLIFADLPWRNLNWNVHNSVVMRCVETKACIKKFKWFLKRCHELKLPDIQSKQACSVLSKLSEFRMMWGNVAANGPKTSIIGWWCNNGGFNSEIDALNSMANSSRISLASENDHVQDVSEHHIW